MTSREPTQLRGYMCAPFSCGLAGTGPLVPGPIWRPELIATALVFNCYCCCRLITLFLFRQDILGVVCRNLHPVLPIYHFPRHWKSTEENEQPMHNQEDWRMVNMLQYCLLNAHCANRGKLKLFMDGQMWPRSTLVYACLADYLENIRIQSVK